jgi:hypothetical protein
MVSQYIVIDENKSRLFELFKKWRVFMDTRKKSHERWFQHVTFEVVMDYFFSFFTRHLASKTIRTGDGKTIPYTRLA